MKIAVITMSNEILAVKIDRELRDLTKVEHRSIVVPQYIYDNLKHPLRPYQEDAIRHFIYTQRSDAADIAYHHLLFHMATGAGKTLVMAACILYLYQEHGYQNFMFFVNSEAIVKKTYDNLTNSASPKYLFRKEGVEINGERITIEAVERFPVHPSPNTIYMKLTSIQKLHMDLNEPKENGVTFESLQDNKMVLLADEAHHINVETKTKAKKLTKAEKKRKNWERTVNQLLKLHQSNRLLGFTATINLHDDPLFDKYHNKIVYQYDLKQFMGEGYSKNVVLLRTNEEDEMKMLHSVLLNQYKKYVAADHGISLKPVILFKSNKINISTKAHDTFLEMIEELTTDTLRHVIDRGIATYQNESSIWYKMFHYYQERNLSSVIRDLQWDFTELTTRNMNDSAQTSLLKEENAIFLNTLEEKNNPIRAIFAVAKLNEGWDVLNLFDIVRISEGMAGTKNTTDSEAQLIGRGARYYPFRYEEETADQRRFDEVPSELKVIETLHYHTINENAYIKNLHRSLNEAQIETKEDEIKRLEAKIKPKVRDSDWFKYGKFYVNKRVPTTPEEYQSFKDYNISTYYEVGYDQSIEELYGQDEERISGIHRHVQDLPLNKVLWQKAIQRNTFFHFRSLKQFVPSIQSIREFIEEERFLGSVQIKVSLPLDISIHDLAPMEILKIAERYLKYVEGNIRLNYLKEKGLRIFEGFSFPEKFKDYTVEINTVNKQTNEVKIEKNMKPYDWYIFDKAIVNGLENRFIEFLIDYVEELKKQYSGGVYLLRNEKQVKLTEFDGTRGFMPDFLLYMKDENCTYQVFIEPKGDHLLGHDDWKENFLEEISSSPNIEVLSENEDVRLLGLKFYSDKAEVKQRFEQDFKEKLYKNR